MLNIVGKRVCETFAEVVAPERAALAVIDIQNTRRWEQGADWVIFDKVKNLTCVARSAGLPVFFFYNTRGPGLRNISAAYIRVLMNLGHAPEQFSSRFDPADESMQVHPGLEPQPEDCIIPKDRGSAFEGTDFQLLLRSLQRETVILVGCSTDWCVEATAWDATNKDYYVVVVEDCVRSPRPGGHEAALRQFRAIGLDVISSQKLLALWAGGAS